MADEVQETREVQTTEAQVGGTNVQQQTVRQVSSAPANVVAQRVVWYIVGVIIVLLVLRVVMLMLGANQSAGFVSFIYSFTEVFAAPFAGIFGTPSYNGQFFLDSASLVAIVVYGLVGWGLAKLFTLGSSHPQA
jgi:uncharacterized membrane protein